MKVSPDGDDCKLAHCFRLLIEKTDIVGSN